MSDEAHFSLSGYVNKQNMRFWAKENPMEIKDVPLHSERVTVQCVPSKLEFLNRSLGQLVILKMVSYIPHRVHKDCKFDLGS